MDSSVGIQVLITSKNCAEYLNECFASIETAMVGYKWMMIFCDDVSVDDTEIIVNTYKATTTADRIVYMKYETPSTSIGAAKNRTCLLSLNYKTEYPVICFMDADDRMGKERISGLLPHLSEKQPLVFGDYIFERYIDGSWQTHWVVTTSMREQHLNFGPWCTLMHSNLIPENGIFFREDIKKFEEMLTWWELKYAKSVKIVGITGFITHYYKSDRGGSCSHSFRREDPNILKDLFNLKMAIHTIPGYE